MQIRVHSHKRHKRRCDMWECISCRVVAYGPRMAVTTALTKVDETVRHVEGLPSADAPWFDVRVRAPMFFANCPAPSSPEASSSFDAMRRACWAVCGVHGAAAEVVATAVPQCSTVDSANRTRDAERTAARFDLKHPETGDATAMLLVGSLHVATGYLRILYGDHGPYFELSHEQVHWAPFTEHVLKGPRRHYHEHYAEASRTTTTDGASDTTTIVKLYDQFNTVADEPNPPPGPWSVNNNRPEGYAPYRVGVLYLAADEVTDVKFATTVD